MSLPSLEFQKTKVSTPRKVTTGLDAVADYFVGKFHQADAHAKKLQQRSNVIHDAAATYHKLSEAKLKSRLREMQVAFRSGRHLTEEHVDEALALLVEAADRTLGLRPFPVQVMCALALENGYLAEMGTGEGKSLTATLAGVLSGWTGKPCHILTTNEYLAGRDSMEFRQFYHYCGVSVGAVLAEMDPENRQKVYQSGVVYTTSKELLADFLRDRIHLGVLHHGQRRLLREMLEPYRGINDSIVLRGIDTAIIDEADSVMIDEAVTPLIISAQQENKWLVEAAKAANSLAADFQQDRDYVIDEKYREVEFNEQGYQLLEDLSQKLPEIWRGSSRREEIMRQAIVARQFYKRDQHYVIEEDKAVIVDEFTGRLMHNRSWGNGLHQAVEAKEGLELSDPTETLARLSFQRFFRVFRKLSGMTGTAKEAADEFWHIYQLPVMTIPTNRPVNREVLEPLYFDDIDSKWDAICDEIVTVSGTGRPVLVGVKSVKSSEQIASRLTALGVRFSILNAINHAEEAMIVKGAGEQSVVTIATNMAGRGTDIKPPPQVIKLGGLHVIVAEKNDSGRIDRQLVGRCARQGDPGSTRSFASFEDDLLTRFGNKVAIKLAQTTADSRPDLSKKFAELAFNRAQKTAQNLASKQRKSVLRTDTWLDEALIFAGSDGIN